MSVFSKPAFITSMEALSTDLPREQKESIILHSAIAHGATSANVYMLLEKGGIHPDSKDHFGETPLHTAFETGAPGSVIATLLYANTDPNARNRKGDPLLHTALKVGSTIPILGALLYAGADPDAKGPDGSTSLHVAIRSNCTLKVVQLLLRHVPPPKPHDQLKGTVSYASANPEARDHSGCSPLHWAAASKTGHLTVPLLIKASRAQLIASQPKAIRLSTVDESVISRIEGHLGIGVHATSSAGDTPIKFTLSSRHPMSPVIQGMLVNAGANFGLKEARASRWSLHSSITAS